MHVPSSMTPCHTLHLLGQALARGTARPGPVSAAAECLAQGVASRYLPAGILTGVNSLMELCEGAAIQAPSLPEIHNMLKNVLELAQQVNEDAAEQVQQEAEAAGQPEPGAVPAVPDVVMVPPRARSPWVSVSGGLESM